MLINIHCHIWYIWCNFHKKIVKFVPENIWNKIKKEPWQVDNDLIGHDLFSHLPHILHSPAPNIPLQLPQSTSFADFFYCDFTHLFFFFFLNIFSLDSLYVAQSVSKIMIILVKLPTCQSYVMTFLHFKVWGIF